jgi:hypothetical protein
LHRFKSPDVASDFKSALDAAMAELETSGVTTVAAETTGAQAEKKEAEKEKKKEEGKKEEEVGELEDLFKAADFFPLTAEEEVGHEVELSFEGQGLKLNTEEDAKGGSMLYGFIGYGWYGRLCGANLKARFRYLLDVRCRYCGRMPVTGKSRISGYF